MKLYVVTREDLTPGQQAVQSCHVIVQFLCDHPEIAQRWYRESNTLALLAVPGEHALIDLIKRAHDEDITASEFREPDMMNALTAVALAPGLRTRNLVARLPLALKK
jgi:peptidyl-tRNA hydrolase